MRFHVDFQAWRAWVLQEGEKGPALTWVLPSVFETVQRWSEFQWVEAGLSPAFVPEWKKRSVYSDRGALFGISRLMSGTLAQARGETLGELRSSGRLGFIGSNGADWSHFHTQRVMGFAYCAHAPVGVDGELAERIVPDTDKLVHRFFTQDERLRWDQIPASGRQRAFLRAWVQKEAWVKALHRRLSGNLGKLGVAIGDQEPMALREVVGEPETSGWHIHEVGCSYLLGGIQSEVVGALATRSAGPLKQSEWSHGFKSLQS